MSLSAFSASVGRALARPGDKSFFSTIDLVNQLESEKVQGRPGQLANRLAHADLVVLEADFRPTESLAIDFSAGTLDFEYTRVDPNTFVTLDMAPPYVPDKKYSLGIQYVFDLANSATLTPRLDYSYRSEMQTRAINTPNTWIDDVGLVNFRLNWESAAGDWSAALAVMNVTDEFYFTGLFGERGNRAGEF